MPDTHPRADGARVLADLNALRAIGRYKTGGPKPTFSEPHVRSLEWLAARLPEAGLSATIDGIGNVVGRSDKAGPKLPAGAPLGKPELRGLARWSARRRLRAGSRARAQHRRKCQRRGGSRLLVR